MSVQLPLLLVVAAIGASLGNEPIEGGKLVLMIPWALLVATNIYVGLKGNVWLKPSLEGKGYSVSNG